jgi:hypothetical protein
LTTKFHAHAAQQREVLRIFALFGHPLRAVVFQRLVEGACRAGRKRV